jgi:Na+/proline symporter
MVVFSFVLVIVTALFMLLGALLYIYAKKEGIGVPLMDGSPKTDLLFPEIALNGNLGIAVAITFILGLIAAAYSSADSALTSLTTSFCVDFLNLKQYDEKEQKRLRKKVHVGMSFLLILVVILFKYILDRNVIDGLLTVAGYTYGPLLGLFFFGIFTSYDIKERYLWPVLLSVLAIVTFLGSIDASVLGGYQLGYELLPLNGLLTFFGLILIRRK